MKRRIFIAGIFLAIAALLLWLVPSRSGPLAAQVLYITNSPNGEEHYVIGVTNAGSIRLKVIACGQFFTNRQWDTSSVAPYSQFCEFLLRPGESSVVASASMGLESGQVMLPYYRETSSAKCTRLLRAWLHRVTEPEILLLNVPPR